MKIHIKPYNKMETIPRILVGLFSLIGFLLLITVFIQWGEIKCYFRGKKYKKMRKRNLKKSSL